MRRKKNAVAYGYLINETDMICAECVYRSSKVGKPEAACSQYPSGKPLTILAAFSTAHCPFREPE